MTPSLFDKFRECANNTLIGGGGVARPSAVHLHPFIFLSSISPIYLHPPFIFLVIHLHTFSLIPKPLYLHPTRKLFWVSYVYPAPLHSWANMSTPHQKIWRKKAKQGTFVRSAPIKKNPPLHFMCPIKFLWDMIDIEMPKLGFHYSRLEGMTIYYLIYTTTIHSLWTNPKPAFLQTFWLVDLFIIYLA